MREGIGRGRTLAWAASASIYCPRRTLFGRFRLPLLTSDRFARMPRCWQSCSSYSAYRAPRLLHSF